MRRVLAFDLDGTFIDEKNEVIGGEETLSLLNRIQSSGFEVVIVTGRLDHDIIHTSRKYSLDIDNRISQNGAVCIRNGKLTAKLLDKKSALNLYSYLKDTGLRVELNTVSGRYWHEDRPEDFPKEFFDSSKIVEDFSEIIEFQPVVLFLIIAQEDNNEALGILKKYVKENYPELQGVGTSKTTLEILAKGVSKGNLLKEIYEDAEIISIGDSESDFTMFPHSKLSYVVGGKKDSGAMALPTIKEALEDITRRYLNE